MLYLKKLKKKGIIPISKSIKTIYCEKKNILLLVSPFEKKILGIKVKIVLLPLLNKIVITDSPVIKKKFGKNLKVIQGTTISKIKQILIEITYTLYYKLSLFGVGYKIFFSKLDYQNELSLKLGFSHTIYFKVSNSLTVNCQRFTKLFLFGNTASSINNLSQTMAKIRYLRPPEPYKGKGFLYDQEKIIIKKKKKI